MYPTNMSAGKWSIVVAIILQSRLCRGGGTGRHAGLKIPWAQAREGSTPSLGTNSGLLEGISQVRVCNLGGADIKVSSY